jgi:DNA mismatch endonuclease, patch repair protein
MVDIVTPAKRSATMAKVRSRDSGPEMTVRRLVYSLGYRFRLHDKRLPGTPDLSLPGRGKVIFVHGCFWHRHPDPHCKLARLPKSRLNYWLPKLAANRRRDLQNMEALTSAGWRVLEIWQCELKDLDGLEQRLISFLE